MKKDTLRSSSKKKGKVRGGSKGLYESGDEVDELAEEEESMDYSEVLVTSGATAPKPSYLDKVFKLDTNCKQSRADITDLISGLSVYSARLLRVHCAKMATVVMKRGSKLLGSNAINKSLFAAETEVFIGSNLDSIGKLDPLEIEDHERKGAKKATTN